MEKYTEVEFFFETWSQDGLKLGIEECFELLILLPLFPKSWEYRYAQPYPAVILIYKMK